MDTLKIDTVTDALRNRIVSGEFGTGGRLPSLSMLAEQHHTSRETINKALQRLQAEGIIVSLGLRGVFVSATKARIPTLVSRFSQYLKELGVEGVDSILGTPTITNASDDVAQFLEVPGQTPIVKVVRRQGTAITHYRLIETFYPKSILPDTIRKQLKVDPNIDVLQLLQKQSHLTVGHVHENIIGRFPTEQEQQLLGIVRGTPVLEINSVYHADDKKIVIRYDRSVLVASYFVLSYDYSVSPDHP